MGFNLILIGVMVVWVLAIIVSCAIELRQHAEAKKMQERWRQRCPGTHR